MGKSKVAGAALKGLGKAFLKRRATIGGVRAGAALKVSKAPSVSTFRARREVLRGVKAPEKIKIEKPGYYTGVAQGAIGTAAAFVLQKDKSKKAEAKEKKEKLEKTAKHHYEKSKKKKDHKKRGT